MTRQKLIPVFALHNGIIYARGEPLCRFASTLAAATWLRAEGFRFVCRVNSTLIFET